MRLLAFIGMERSSGNFLAFTSAIQPTPKGYIPSVAQLVSSYRGLSLPSFRSDCRLRASFRSSLSSLYLFPLCGCLMLATFLKLFSLSPACCLLPSPSLFSLSVFPTEILRFMAKKSNTNTKVAASGHIPTAVDVL